MVTWDWNSGEVRAEHELGSLSMYRCKVMGLNEITAGEQREGEGNRSEVPVALPYFEVRQKGRPRSAKETKKPQPQRQQRDEGNVLSQRPRRQCFRKKGICG